MPLRRYILWNFLFDSNGQGSHVLYQKKGKELQEKTRDGQNKGEEKFIK